MLVQSREGLLEAGLSNVASLSVATSLSIGATCKNSLILLCYQALL
jgi:hypothetical protein